MYIITIFFSLVENDSVKFAKSCIKNCACFVLFFYSIFPAFVSVVLERRRQILFSFSHSNPRLAYICERERERERGEWNGKGVDDTRTCGQRSCSSHAMFPEQFADPSSRALDLIAPDPQLDSLYNVPILVSSTPTFRSHTRPHDAATRILTCALTIVFCISIMRTQPPEAIDYVT
jgi:hypothetical protein